MSIELTDPRYKGTRLDGEKEFYETYFGGDTRAENVMISTADGGNAATPLGLQAMQEVGHVKQEKFWLELAWRRGSSNLVHMYTSRLFAEGTQLCRACVHMSSVLTV